MAKTDDWYLYYQAWEGLSSSFPFELFDGVDNEHLVSALCEFATDHLTQRPELLASYLKQYGAKREGASVEELVNETKAELRTGTGFWRVASLAGWRGGPRADWIRTRRSFFHSIEGETCDASLKLTINANSLRVVNDVKEKDRHDIERTMRDEVLETRKYPEIVFQSRNVSLSRIGEGRYRARVIGDLTLHGVTQNNIWINGEVTVNNDGLRTRGDFAIKQSDYKIKLVSVAGGTLKIKNEVKGRFEIGFISV